VLEYRVHITSRGRSTKQVFPAVADTAAVNISDLSCDEEYFLAVDAATQAGYNDSLQLETIYITTSASGMFLKLSFKNPGQLCCLDITRLTLCLSWWGLNVVWWYHVALITGSANSHHLYPLANQVSIPAVLTNDHRAYLLLHRAVGEFRMLENISRAGSYV